MRNIGRIAVTTAGVLLLWHGTSFAALDKCQKRLQGETAKLQKFVYSAVQKCADAIRKEQVAGITKGGNDCSPGKACLPAAAATCEKELAKVYGVGGLVPFKSKFDAFRIAMEKSRTPNGAGARECEDADLAILTGMGHLVSGTGASVALAPPLGTNCDFNSDTKIDANCGASFMTNFLMYSIENVVLKQAIQQTPDLLSIMTDAIEATTANPAKPSTVCDGTPAPIAGTAFRPNLCRFGLQCRTAVCEIDNSVSKVTLGAPQLDLLMLTPLDISISGTLATEVCRPGPTAGKCKTGGASCESDADCGVNAPCNFFPGQGLGAAFGGPSNVIYLINSAAKGVRAPEPPVPTPPFNTLLTAACVDIVESEGWCDCSPAGLGVKNGATVCQDKDALDSAGANDECGASKTLATADSHFTTTLQNGPLTIQPAGSSAPGDCVDLVTLQFKLITSAADKGPDGIACTDDDYVAPTATFTIPLTTGSVTAAIYDAPDVVGLCSTTTTATCLVDADCPPTETCTGGNPPTTVPLSTLGPIVGAKPVSNQCARYLAGNLSGLSLVSGATALSLPIDLGGTELPVDGLLNFRLSCQ